MAGWKENKMVAIVAVVIVVLSIGLIVKMAMSKQGGAAKLTPEQLRQQAAIEQQMRGGK